MPIDPTYFKRKAISNNKTTYYFDTVTDYNRFINESTNSFTGNARQGLNEILDPNYVRNSARDRDWYGTTDASLVTENIDTYLFNNELDNFLGNVRQRTVNIDIIDLDQQKAIKFTEKELGVFSFDLASLGLIRVFEYYSPLLKDIVSGNLVKSERLPSGDLVFYYVGTPYVPEHYVTFDIGEGLYYSNILKRYFDTSQLIEVDNMQYKYPEKDAIEKHIVEQRQVRDAKGNLKFATTFKKCFIEIPKVEKPLPRIDIIINSSFSSDVSAETEMIYSSMAAISIAEKLSKSGVNYRIIAAYPVNSVNRNKEVYTFVNVKKEGEAFDRNRIAVLLSDGRQFRFQQFKGFLATQFDAGYNSDINPISIGRPITDSDRIKNSYLEYLSLSDNPEDVKASLMPRSKIVFSGALNQQQAEDQYNNIIQEISRL
jgi:hypothetical protein